MSTDAEAIEAIRGGETERYGELVERYERAVYAIAWSRLGDTHLSEEAVQETFVQGFRYLAGLRRPEKFPAWIARIGRRMASAIGRRRRRELARRERWDVDELASPQTRRTNDERSSETLGQALAALPDSHRESLVLFYLEGKSVREAAEVLGISEGAFKVRLHRARGKLRQAMEERLERSLRGLAPRHGVRKPVLAVIPAFPLGWGVKVGALGALSSAAAMVLALTPSIVLTWYLVRCQADNYRDPGGFRQARLRRNTVRSLVTAAVAFAAGGLLVSSGWGFRPLYGFLAVCFLPGIARGARTVRVSTSGWTIAGFVWLCGMEAAVGAFAFLGASLAWFWLSMLTFFVMRWLTRRNVAPRGDYSLFLRAAYGGLGAPDGEVMPYPAAGRERMKAFAQFLGDRHLAVDYSTRRSRSRAEFVIYSTPLTKRAVLPLRYFPASLSGDSTISIRSDGTFMAHVNDRDLHELRALDPARQLDARELERRVADVVRVALGRFLAGDTAGAEALVQAEPNEAIFKQPPHRLVSQRIVFVFGFAGSLAMFLASLFGGVSMR